ncbi:hypothetical protein AQJ84_39585 [Streptomyces resistomycificus]|uniref:Uncharacterized protein n=2 Tax=Streptomyces resistomycificus TaxID=67356 RepID=A0A0L8L3E9_9ACTN|nr:hypothetical protein ADK37_26490 [Streptomyces resistomycificus]KUN90558.1 hypothetical protein AQJ84_39585 [Streptomyces resistomycificus]
MVAGSVMLSTTALLATGLVWVTSARQRERHVADRAAARQQEEVRGELAELGRRVTALQRLLEGVD